MMPFDMTDMIVQVNCSEGTIKKKRDKDHLFAKVGRSQLYALFWYLIMEECNPRLKVYGHRHTPR